MPDLAVRVVGRTSAERGELGERVARDILFTLGYDNFRSVVDSALQLDVLATHRTEPRSAAAEAKAWKERVGGKEVRDFQGKLASVKPRVVHSTLEGYFIALGGFTDGIVEQVRKAPSRHKLHLIDGERAAELLSDGRIVLTPAEAIAAAIRAATRADADVGKVRRLELIAHGDGWAWAVHFSELDGTVLLHGFSGDLVTQEIAAHLCELDSDLAPSSKFVLPDLARARQSNAFRRYKDYLDTAFGAITFEGLTQDVYAASMRSQVEDIYVPLQFTPVEATDEALDPERLAEPSRRSLGAVLDSYQHVAFIAPPGGGKTTVVKRIALAYAFGDRYEAADDALAERDIVPFVVRCRQLEAGADRPLLDVLKGIAVTAAIISDAPEFEQLVTSAVQHGRALVLLDGLDEMSEGDRLRLVRALRVFVAANPDVRTIVTARPAGFRAVAGRVADVSQVCAVLPMTNGLVTSFVHASYAALEGRSDQSTAKATDLVNKILANDRLLRLARNPLLLTTLLMVRRGVGDLPDQRSVLYDETLRVLLSTWNQEGHDPIPRAQALPLLAWLAFALAEQERFSVAEVEMTRILQVACDSLPEYYGFQAPPLADFAERLELRSSILILSGRINRDGRLQRLYEFRHKTIQEFLAAYAVSEGFCEPRVGGASAEAVLLPYLGDPSWEHIVPLAASLLGRDAASLCQALLSAVSGGSEAPARSRRSVLEGSLGQILLDRVPSQPDIVVDAALALSGTTFLIDAPSQSAALACGLYGETFVQQAAAGLRAHERDMGRHADSLGSLANHRTPEATSPCLEGTIPSWGVLGLSEFHRFEQGLTARDPFPAQFSYIEESVDDERAHVRLLAIRAVAARAARSEDPQPTTPLVARLIDRWHSDPFPAVQTSAARALTALLTGPTLRALPVDRQVNRFVLERQLGRLAQPVPLAARRGAALALASCMRLIPHHEVLGMVYQFLAERGDPWLQLFDRTRVAPAATRDP